MQTLYLCNVPDKLVDRLGRPAARHHMSVDVVTIRELADASPRADNPILRGEPADLGVATAAILDGLRTERTGG